MNRKAIPYLFLLLLIIIIIFIVGVKYGSHVEKTNKTINYILSIPPTRPPTTPTLSLTSYQTYENKICGIKFLYPTTIKKATAATNEAVFKQADKTLIHISCSIGKTTISIIPINNATASLIFQNKPLLAQKNGNSYTFQLKDQNKTFFITIDQHLYPLFENTVQFLP